MSDRACSRHSLWQFIEWKFQIEYSLAAIARINANFRFYTVHLSCWWTQKATFVVWTVTSGIKQYLTRKVRRRGEKKNIFFIFESELQISAMFGKYSNCFVFSLRATYKINFVEILHNIFRDLIFFFHKTQDFYPLLSHTLLCFHCSLFEI